MKRSSATLLALVGGAALLTLAIAFLAFWAIGLEADEAILRAGVTAAAAAIAAPLGLALRTRRMSTGVSRGRLEVSIQVREGEYPGLGSGWQAGELVLDERPLRLIPMRGGIRFLRGHPVTIDLSDVRPSARRTPTRAAWSVAPGLPILEMVTAGAQLDLAVPVGLEARVLDALRSL